MARWQRKTSEKAGYQQTSHDFSRTSYVQCDAIFIRIIFVLDAIIILVIVIHTTILFFFLFNIMFVFLLIFVLLLLHTSKAQYYDMFMHHE